MAPLLACWMNGSTTAKIHQKEPGLRSLPRAWFSPLQFSAMEVPSERFLALGNNIWEEETYEHQKHCNRHVTQRS